MSASETASGATNLHQSIEQLIAETVRQSQSTHEAEQQRLAEALKSALAEIESGQQALNRAAGMLRNALGVATSEAQNPEIVEESPEPTPQSEAVQPIAAPAEVVPTSEPTNDRGQHELDVIAHNANITNATGLQSWLRGREEVSTVQIREFVNGELRLHLDLGTGLEMTAFKTWLSEHAGSIVTSTDNVIEIRFGTAV